MTFAPAGRKFGSVAGKKRQSRVVSRSGRFTSGPARDVAAFTESVSFDRRLWKHDIQGSIAHATMLRRAGILSRAELAAIVKGLEQIAREIAAGREDLSSS